MTAREPVAWLNCGMNSAHLQAWWAHKQGLLATTQGSTPASILERVGWARSVAGANPYLTLRARGGCSRIEVDKAAENVEISELPSARGCTYVLPASDFDLGLALARANGSPDLGVAAKLGVPGEEIDNLCVAVLEALAAGPLDPAALKTRLGDKVRNLGEAGKKKGLTTTLPVALGRLQIEGEILRRPLTGRFDCQRYAYVRWQRPKGKQLTPDEAYLQLAKRYFAWIGPASLANFCWFSGLGVRAGMAVLDQLPLTPIEVDSDLLIPTEELDAFHAFQRPGAPVYRAVNSMDGLFLHRRDVQSHFDPADTNRTMQTSKGVVEARNVHELSSNAIIDRGQIIGLWEYDPGSKEVVYSPFRPETPEVTELIRELRDWVENELGDVRTFSLDSPESRKPILDALRAGI